MAEPLDSQVLVAGTGPAGLVAALLLARAGFSVRLAGPAARRDDARTTALMEPALEALAGIGLETDFKGAAAPLATMRIVDGTRRLIRSPIATFHAAEIGKPSFGMNIPNAVLNTTLESAVEAEPRIGWHKHLVSNWELPGDRVIAVLEDGTRLAASLGVAADGRDSPARRAAGIRLSERRLDQCAFITSFSHERGHGNISTEFHTETGPFTIVPLPGNRASLVWVVRPETAGELLALEPEALSQRIEERMQSMLGRIVADGPRQSYPLATALPSAFAAKRIALVGEAAHLFPPIGAQGLNLGIRDAVDLARAAAAHREDPGAPAALAAYERARRPDILARSRAVALLNRSLLSDLLPMQILRGAGLGLLSAISPLRAFFMREGMRPGSGIASLLRRGRPERDPVAEPWH